MELHHSTKSELTNLFLDKDLVSQKIRDKMNKLVLQFMRPKCAVQDVVHHLPDEICLFREVVGHEASVPEHSKSSSEVFYLQSWQSYVPQFLPLYKELVSLIQNGFGA